MYAKVVNKLSHRISPRAPHLPCPPSPLSLPHNRTRQPPINSTYTIDDMIGTLMQGMTQGRPPVLRLLLLLAVVASAATPSCTVSATTTCLTHTGAAPAASNSEVETTNGTNTNGTDRNTARCGGSTKMSTAFDGDTDNGISCWVPCCFDCSTRSANPVTGRVAWCVAKQDAGENDIDDSPNNEREENIMSGDECFIAKVSLCTPDVRSNGCTCHGVFLTIYTTIRPTRTHSFVSLSRRTPQTSTTTTRPCRRTWTSSMAHTPR